MLDGVPFTEKCLPLKSLFQPPTLAAYSEPPGCLRVHYPWTLLALIGAVEDII